MGTASTEDQYGHAVDKDGQLIYDARCWFCRQTTAQPRPPTGHYLARILTGAHQESRP